MVFNPFATSALAFVCPPPVSSSPLASVYMLMYCVIFHPARAPGSAAFTLYDIHFFLRCTGRIPPQPGTAALLCSITRLTGRFMFHRLCDRLFMICPASSCVVRSTAVVCLRVRSNGIKGRCLLIFQHVLEETDLPV